MKINPITSHFVILLLFANCSENNLREKAVDIFDANFSGKNQKHILGENITRSSDGLQFTKSHEDGNQSETVGLTKDGKISFEGKMQNGKPHGVWITFYPDGRPRWKGIKNEGVSHGPFTMWYQNGRKKMEGAYENGQKHGISTMWHLNGSKWKEQNHSKGRPTGNWRTWNDKGGLIEEISHGSAIEIGTHSINN